MPQTLCTSFTESRAYEQLRNEYHDGTPQGSQLAQTSRRTWNQSRRLNAVQLNTLEQFFADVGGGWKPFWFYNVYEGTPIGSNYDATGVNPTGRYPVAFRCNWTQTTGLARTDVPNLELIELAPPDATWLENAGFGPHGAVTSCVLNVLTSHTGGSPIACNACVSTHGLSLVDHPDIVNDSTNWTLRTDAHPIDVSSVGSLNLLFVQEAYSGGLGGTPDSPPDLFQIYDCWIVITFSDAATKTLRGTAVSAYPNESAGTLSNVNNAIDGDPGTYATITYNLPSTLGYGPYFWVSGFQVSP